MSPAELDIRHNFGRKWRALVREPVRQEVAEALAALQAGTMQPMRPLWLGYANARKAWPLDLPMARCTRSASIASRIHARRQFYAGKIGLYPQQVAA